MLQRLSFGECLAHFWRTDILRGVWGVQHRKAAVWARLSPVAVRLCWVHAQQRAVLAWLRALGGGDAGKGAVLGDLVQFPSVPLIVGKLLSIPTPRFPAWQAGRVLLCVLCWGAGKNW